MFGGSMDTTNGRLWQAVAGLGAVAAPWWIAAMQEISMLAGWVTSLGGAVVTIHAVWKLFRRRTTEAFS
jgi:hypothetical protein